MNHDLWNFKLNRETLFFDYTIKSNSLKDINSYKVIWTGKNIPLLLITTKQGSVMFYKWNGVKWIKKTVNKLYTIKIISAVWTDNELHIIASKDSYVLHFCYKDDLWETNILPIENINLIILAFYASLPNKLHLYVEKNKILYLWEYDLHCKKWLYKKPVIILNDSIIKKFFYFNKNWSILTIKKENQLKTLNYCSCKNLNKEIEVPIIKYKNILFEKGPFILINKNSIGVLGIKKDKLFLLISHTNGLDWNYLFSNHLYLKYEFEEIRYCSGNYTSYIALTKINNRQLYSPIIMHINDLELLLRET